MNISIFGIRHHGPGSAKSLNFALEELKPDIILIEGPPDADGLIKYIANEELKPPVALLAYNPKELMQASYFPFAEFSPEWQAMKFAIKEDIEVRFMDLPQKFQFALKQEELSSNTFEFEQKEEVEKGEEVVGDPLTYIAQIAGYEDSERWWEVTFEHIESQAAVFPAILELMTELRNGLGKTETPMTLLREAFMRKTIRQAKKEGFQNIAVVCGAWHSPVLDVDKFKASHDSKVLRGLKRVTVKTTWVPWSYERISTQSGYGAGVLSPAWYSFLFESRDQVVIRWMTEVARLFRKEDVSASSAHVIEGVRLAETLATLRNLSLPGIDELFQAATTIFCQGDATPMDLVQRELIVGKKIGFLPVEIPTIPLQQDIEKQIKSARLNKEWKAPGTIEKKLDTRKPTQLQASHLIHRLIILGISWGVKQRIRGDKKGSFHELWRLTWDVNFSMAIIEAGMWGNTVYSAAVNYACKRAENLEDLPQISKVVNVALEADLKDAIPRLIHNLRDSLAMTKDVSNMMDALNPLVKVLRYGNTRGTDTGSVEQVVNQMIPRICISLPAACTSINAEAAELLFAKLTETNRNISILNAQRHTADWNRTLETITNGKEVNPLLLGACSRMLFDKSVWDIEKTATAMQFALSSGSSANQAADWLEGFLDGSGLLLIYNLDLWNILDGWVHNLDMETLKELLPLLRRTFSSFTPVERQKMLNLAKQGSGVAMPAKEEQLIDEERAAKVLPILQFLLE